MSTPIGSVRLSKLNWYAAGGFENPRCWRRWRRGWAYYYMVD